MVFFGYTQPADLSAGLEGGGLGQELPLDLVLQPLVLQLVDVAGQTGPLTLAGVLEVVSVVVEPELEGGGRHAHIALLPLPHGRHAGLVDDRGILAT